MREELNGFSSPVVPGGQTVTVTAEARGTIRGRRLIVSESLDAVDQVIGKVIWGRFFEIEKVLIGGKEQKVPPAPPFNPKRSVQDIDVVFDIAKEGDLIEIVCRNVTDKPVTLHVAMISDMLQGTEDSFSEIVEPPPPLPPPTHSMDFIRLSIPSNTLTSVREKAPIKMNVRAFKISSETMKGFLVEGMEINGVSQFTSQGSIPAEMYGDDTEFDISEPFDRIKEGDQIEIIIQNTNDEPKDFKAAILYDLVSDQ